MSTPAADDIKVVATPDAITATIGRKKIVISTVIDLEEMLDIVEAVEGIDDEADVKQALLMFRKVVPPAFLEKVKGVDSVVALKLFMTWVGALGDRLGKALT